MKVKGHHEQQKSKLEKHGEGSFHEKAKDRLVKILRADHWNVQPDCGFAVHTSLDDQNKTDFTETEWYHPFDIYAKKTHQNNLWSSMIIEIDGKRHDKEAVKQRDKEIERYAAFFFRNTWFIRIKISMLLNQSIPDSTILHLIKSQKEQFGVLGL
jgi:hypothetical protein